MNVLVQFKLLNNIQYAYLCFLFQLFSIKLVMIFLLDYSLNASLLDVRYEIFVLL